MWSEIGCAAVKISVHKEETACGEGVNDLQTDGKNHVAWLGKDTWPFGAYVLGVTLPHFG